MNFVMVFMEAIRISVMVYIVFFQQGNYTYTVLHIIDHIELKLDCKVKIANQIAISVKKENKSLLDIFPKSHSPRSECLCYVRIA